MFKKKINLQSLDKIILNESDLKVIENKLKIYIDNNPRLAIKVKEVPLKVSLKGIYEMKMNEKTDNPMMKRAIELIKKKDVNMSDFLVQRYFYDLESDFIKFGEIDKEGNIFYIIKFDIKMNHIDTQVFDSNLKETAIKNNLQKVGTGIITQITSFMKYSQLMAFLNEESSIIKRQSHIKSYQPKRMTKKELEREARKRVSVSKPKVDYDYNEAERIGGKRPYERVVEAWEVGGHWRTYKKSGKRVFVKGYKKGNGNVNKKGKDFTL